VNISSRDHPLKGLSGAVGRLHPSAKTRGDLTPKSPRPSANYRT